MTPSPAIAVHPARILIVDDDRANREVLAIILIHEGFLIETAASGAEALATAAKQPFDLVLLDIMMAEMSGYELAATMKSNLATKNIPIIVITALTDHATRLRALRAGAADFLTKPLDRAELCRRVRKALPIRA